MKLSKNGLLRRVAARLGYVKRDEIATSRRSFAAAQINRLTQSWSAFGISLDSVLNQELPTLRNRARNLAESNEYFQKFLSMLKSNVVGECGMTLKNKACDPHTFADGELIKGKPDKLANALIEEAFCEWCKKENCTTAKNMTWTQVQNLAIEEWGTCGETLWQLVRGPAAGNKFNFALRPIAIDRLWHQSNYNLSNGNTVRMGVEKDQDGKVVAYWITKTDPTDILFNKGGAYSPQRIDAKEFVHPFLMRRIGQSRGVPWAAASMLRLKMLADYDQAEITGSVAASRKMAFLTSGLSVPSEYGGEAASGGGKYMDAEDACIEELPYGKDIKVLDWNHPNSIYGDFTSACLRGIACGLNVSYPNLANDYASVNFSSGRMARIEEIEFWKTIQSAVTTDFHEPIFAAWLEMSLLAGVITYALPSGREITLPASKLEKFNAPRFHGRRWQWLDPTKEVAAIAEQLRLKLTTRTKICADLGEEWLDIIDELELEQEEAAKRGITLPEDVEQGAALAAANLDNANAEAASAMETADPMEAE